MGNGNTKAPIYIEFSSLSEEEKDELSKHIESDILKGKEHEYGFDIWGTKMFVRDNLVVDIHDVIGYTMKKLQIHKPYILVKNTQAVKYHILFVQDL